MTHTCADCGNTFAPARADAAYCSSACRQRAYRSRNAKAVTALTGEAATKPHPDARMREKRPNPMTCNIDGWNQSLTMFSHHADALLRNPTYAQAGKLAKMLARTQRRVEQVMAQIEEAAESRQ